MSARAFSDGVTAALTGDAAFASAITALLGQPVTRVIDGNVPLANLPADHVPCFVVEQGDGRSASISQDNDDGIVIGLGEQQFASDLYVSMVWTQQDREIAAQQRKDLPQLFAQLMLRNPQPGGIAFASLGEWEPDRGIHHPLQVWRASLTGEYSIPRV